MEAELNHMFVKVSIFARYLYNKRSYEILTTFVYLDQKNTLFLKHRIT